MCRGFAVIRQARPESAWAAGPPVTDTEEPVTDTEERNGEVRAGSPP